MENRTAPLPPPAVTPSVTPSATPSITPDPIWTRNFLLVTLVNLFIFLAHQILLPTTPLYARTLGASDTTIGLMAGLLTVAAVLFRYIAGTAADRFGRSVVLWIGLASLSVVTVLYGILPGLAAFFLLRIAHGIGWGVVSTATATVATDFIPSSRFGLGMNYFSLSTSLAIAFAPVVGIFLFTRSGSGALFAAAFVMMVAATVFAFPIRHISLGVRPGRQATEVRYSPWKTIRPSLTMAIICIGYGAVISFLPLFAQEKGIENIGSYFTVYALSMVFLRPWFGRLADRHGYGRILYPGIILLGGGLLILAFSTSYGAFMVSALLYGIGFSATQATLQTLSAIHVPVARLGVANAIFFMLFDGGLGIGSIIAGFLAAWTDYRTMFLIMAFMLVAAVIFHAVSDRFSADFSAARKR
ncbi:MFS transporter [Parasphaerochaeta coccoides]|uniref:MFS transporter n=1 Tax=Parasphaerochaeta coccoides TaxID=273376 RepID=UPI001C0676B2|nr:MFS transporter [Parasphaerochaeta coccoides]